MAIMERDRHAARMIADLVGRLRRGALSAADAVAAQLAALHALHGRTNAVAAFDDARALSDASGLDDAFARSGPVGPLHGLPITVKDWIDVEGFPCAGETDDHDRRPQADATVVRRLRAAGAVVIAKTRPWGGVTHPVDPGRSPGGSSSGEGVAVAGGASPLGIGSDSGGSIRLPSAWCGVFGLKPSDGRVPTTGHFPRVGAKQDGRTQIGPLATCVDDLELVLSLISGPDGRDGGTAPVPLVGSGEVDVARLRFAVVEGEAGWHPEPALVAAVRDATAALVAAGAEQVDWPRPTWLADALDVTRRYWRRAGGDTRLTGADVYRQLMDWDRFRYRSLEATESIDLILTPATLGPAPLLREMTAEDYIFMLPASLTGAPAVVVPTGTDPAGLPIAVQLVGRPWEDPVVLAAARAIS